MKILELCIFSAGGCGVWQRVKQEAQEFHRLGEDVLIFSSNLEKGSNKIVSENDSLDGIKIRRFSAIKLGGESFMYWFSKKALKEALAFSPDVIFAHNYRHLHTLKALKIAKILRKKGKKCKVFLVTHAPFVEGDITRSFISKWIVRFYDKLIGPVTLNKFDKILAISKWEIHYLLRAGARKSKIEYVPNGIPEEFFTQKRSRAENKILFLGRIAPKKKLETLLSSIPYIKDKKIKIEIVGPSEKDYLYMLKNLISRLKISNRIIFSKPIYNLKQKIRKIDSCSLFVLPSRVEGMPQALIEAMARGKIVVGSDSIAIRDLIKDGKNGYLFEFNNPESLAEKINLALNKNNKRLGINAKNYAKRFRWSRIMTKIYSIIRN